MPSRRSRSRSNERSKSPERRAELPNGVSPISESQYFQKSDEFRLWLKEEKGKYFDSLSGDRARSYFRKFVKAWNRGKLSQTYYDGINSASIPATINTAYKWSFVSKNTRADDNALRNAREEVGAATYGQDPIPSSVVVSHGEGSSSRPGGGRIQGPAMPPGFDLTLAREQAAEHRDEERVHKRKRDKLETKERIEEMVGPKPVGREGMLENKKLKRENDRDFREKGDEGLEIDEKTLMGGGDSFKAQIARRDMAKRRHEQKNEEKNSAIRKRATEVKEKEKATMDMFQQLAKQRFG